MGRVFSTFLQGLAVTAPVVFTVYVLVASVRWLDRVMFGLVESWFGESVSTFWGLGAITALGMIYLIGLLMRLYLFRKLVGVTEKLFGRVPLVKTLYGSIRDLLQFFQQGGSRPAGKAVKVELGPHAHMIGITTSQDPDTGRVGVYLPLSYQIGGFLVYMPPHLAKGLDMDVETALKLVLTGGMGSSSSESQAEIRFTRELPVPDEKDLE